MSKVRRTVACALATTAVLAVASPASAQTVWAVGDGGVAETTDDDLAAFVESAGAFDRFVYLGDVYETGTAQDFAENYHPSFGRFKDRSSPTPGNHEWANRATGYDAYWGALAPQTNGGHWYSFDVGDWHFVSLNTEEPIAADSPQIAWLKEDLAKHGGTCTVAFMHRPRHTATEGLGVTERAGHVEVWNALKGRAVAVLAGHDHNYERFQPVDGIVEFIVGTGGRARHGVNEADPRLAYANDQVFGALRLQLARGSAQFAFFATNGTEALDSGSLACTPHPKPPTAAFEWSPQAPVAGQQVTFTSTSSDPDGPLTEWAWDLDHDGEYDDAQGSTTETSFPAAGTHDVGLRVTDGQGGTDTVVRRMDVGAPPSEQSPRGPQPPPEHQPLPAPLASRLGVLTPRHGAVHSRRLRRLRGEVANAAGPVSVVLVRRGRHGCTRFDGRRFVRASCRTRAGVDVPATSWWLLSLPSSARLHPGVYRLTARTNGADGIKRLAGVTFRIR